MHFAWLLVFFAEIVLEPPPRPICNRSSTTRSILSACRSCILPTTARSLPLAAYTKRGLLAITEPVMATTKPKLLLLIIQATSMWQERCSVREHSMI